jgi:hypothetical protein
MAKMLKDGKLTRTVFKDTDAFMKEHWPDLYDRQVEHRLDNEHKHEHEEEK